MKTAQDWIEKLQLFPHPEGGYYRETYRSTETIAKDALDIRFSGDRVFSTAIYFLLEKEQFSAFHRIYQDELWHFYQGDSLLIHVIRPDGGYEKRVLGAKIEQGDRFQVVVEAGSFFAAELQNPDSYALVGCTVAPGFDFSDFFMPSKGELLKLFPKQKELIEKLGYEANK